VEGAEGPECYNSPASWVDESAFQGPMGFPAGARLGPYEIEAFLGAEAWNVAGHN